MKEYRRQSSVLRLWSQTAVTKPGRPSCMCINKHASCRSGQKKRCPQSTWCSLCSINAGYSYFLAMHCVEGNLPAWSMWHNKLVSSKECEPTARWLKIIWKTSYESKFNCTSFVTTLACKWAILSWFCCLQFAFLHSLVRLISLNLQHQPH